MRGKQGKEDEKSVQETIKGLVDKPPNLCSSRVLLCIVTHLQLSSSIRCRGKRRVALAEWRSPSVSFLNCPNEVIQDSITIRYIRLCEWIPAAENKQAAHAPSVHLMRSIWEGVQKVMWLEARLNYSEEKWTKIGRKMSVLPRDKSEADGRPPAPDLFFLFACPF